VPLNTDPTVFVEPTLEKPEATVSGGALGTGIKGSFQLSLHLGPRATGSSQVKLGVCNVLDAEKKGEIVSALPVTTQTELPVSVELDSDVDLSFTFDSGTKPLPSEVLPALCDPAGVVLGGTIEDSLQDRATPFASAVFHPAGCM
jgi:hypothetical protein